jgi:hypothetical protein
MSQNPFYTLNELIVIPSCAEAQVLDVIEHDLGRGSWQAAQDDHL